MLRREQYPHGVRAINLPKGACPIQCPHSTPTTVSTTVSTDGSTQVHIAWKGVGEYVHALTRALPWAGVWPSVGRR